MTAENIVFLDSVEHNALIAANTAAELPPELGEYLREVHEISCT